MPSSQMQEQLPVDETVPVIPTEETLYTIRPVTFGWIVLVSAFLSYLIFSGLLAFLVLDGDFENKIPQARIITVVSQLLFLLLPALLLVRLQPWTYKKLLSLQKPKTGHVFIAIATVLLLHIPIGGLMALQEYLVSLISPAAMDTYQQYKDAIALTYNKFATAYNLPELIAVLLVIAVTPALCEELLFRGVALGAFRRGTGTTWSIVATGAVFGMFHLNPVTFLPLMALGSVFAWLVVKTGSVVPAIIAHLTNNTIAVFSLYFLRGADFAFEPETTGNARASFMLIASAVSLAVLFAMWAKYLPANRPSQ